MSPIRVDFYLLASTERQARALLACRLLEKAYLRGHQIFVYCNNQNEAESFDELLWTFKPDSFIPHNLQGEGPDSPPPIQIGYNPEVKRFSDILLNLADNVPDFYQQFNRVIEIVTSDDTAKEISRSHYRIYRDNNCKLSTHTIEN